MPESENELAWIAFCSTRRFDGRFFISSNRSCSVAPAIFSRKVSIWISPRAEDQRLPVVPISVLRHQLRRHAEPDAGRCGILDQLPAVVILAAAHRGRERPALLRASGCRSRRACCASGTRARPQSRGRRNRNRPSPTGRRSRSGRTGSRYARRPAARHRQRAAPALQRAAGDRGLFLVLLGRVFLGCGLFGRFGLVPWQRRAGPPARASGTAPALAVQARVRSR